MKRLAFALFICLIQLLSCVPTFEQKIQLNRNYNFIQSENINIFIQPEFEYEHNKFIIQSLNHWQDKTYNSISWNYMSWDNQSNFHCKKNIIFLKYHSDSFLVAKLDKKYNMKIGGYAIYHLDDNCKNNYIILVYNRLTEKGEFFSVSLHEIGHVFGLGHNNEISIMNYDHMFETNHLEPYDIHTYFRLNNQSTRPEHIMAGN